jgi:hypothetical protein
MEDSQHERPTETVGAELRAQSAPFSESVTVIVLDHGQATVYPTGTV